MKKKTGRSYLVDSKGIYHFHDDCSVITGKVKRIYRSDFLKYHPCQVCQQKNNDIVLTYKADMEKNEGKYMAELLDNVGKLEVSDKEKEDIALRGLLAIRMQRFIWSALADFQDWGISNRR